MDATTDASTPGTPATAPGAARAALLVLADGRFPAGGHAHSGGAEAAVKAGRVRDAADLAAFCRGRLHTTGLTSAALAAAAAAGVDPLALDEAADARTPSPALRATARKLGRQLMRAARATWPCDALDTLAAARPRGAHQPVVLGVTARAAGLGPEDAAHCVVYESVSGPATAVVRLLGLDPFEATAVLARLAPELDQVARRAADAAHRALTEGAGALPAASAPLLDITAQAHAAWPVRLFAS
ncbi:urease accessory protein UreF [Streptomyces agglomeratus]|uniref:Urease accessory protein UreF n=1 Tax=Streptomyces agglomeratus TaxID=285458 RepID=A0A1E5PEX0_9ACTN|nr:urease accessory UreF family protein [Streptomyces agglomeratus]OEJ28080.1 urease accessory protein UreF [Streptomyces agglomeratus]OEJ37857.1 urease accessory protein UreF [Streptomyces agglomeratus]OEJ47758.1 urease accessory protein UreF [Streptomyces agglomeratus]OEJ50392.1 urease accessory protein UreF [Streptomyces agglomeratus]OEJ57721.1 urease accessory protein UreF [Streptomyces agglomeratus]